MKTNIIFTISVNLPHKTNHEGKVNESFDEALTLFGLDKLKEKEPSGKETNYQAMTFFTAEDIEEAGFTEEELQDFVNRRIVYGLLFNLSIQPMRLIFHNLPNGGDLMKQYDELRQSPAIAQLRKEHIEYKEVKGAMVPKLKSASDLGAITREVLEMGVKDSLSMGDYVKHFFQSFTRALIEAFGSSCNIVSTHDQVKLKQFTNKISKVKDENIKPLIAM
jgi:hypothetical protein